MTESDGAEHPRRTTPEGAAASIETVFEQLVGRKATEPERERLYRLRQVLGLRDNDAFWSIVMASNTTMRLSECTRRSSQR